MADQPWKQSERERFSESLRAAGLNSVLEIGAGHGVSGRYLAGEGFDLTCIDLSPELVEECRRAGLRAQVMDFSNLVFPLGSFDAAFGMNCLLHVPRAELPAVLRSVRRVLRPGGLFYWGQYTLGEPLEGIYDEDSYEPKRFFAFLTDDEITAAACEEFELVDFRRITLRKDGWEYHAVILRAGE
jgi:SAM-dependent methyltransferase